MAEQLYDLTFNGELLEGFFIDFVKADLKSIFKSSDAYIDALFSGPNQAVKLKVDKATAIKFQKAFKQAGAKLIVRAHNPALLSQSANTSKKPTESAAKAPANTKAADLETTLEAVSGENADDLIEHHQPDIASPTAVPDWDVASPGAQLVETPSSASVEIDTSALSLAEAGSDLAGNGFSFEEPAPIINIEALSLAPAGTEIDVLDDKPEPVVVDISHLSTE